MEPKKYSSIRLEVNCGGIYGMYWVTCCAMSSYAAVYLAYRGFNYTEIGLTTSLIYFISLLMQIFIADFSDKHFSFPIKRIIILMFIGSMIFGAVAHFIPLPIALMMIVYSIAQAFSYAIDCFISSLIVQFNNLGVKVNYGFPRSWGSVFFSIFAVILGDILERNTPDFLMPTYIVLCIPAIILVLLIPAPPKYASAEVLKAYERAVIVKKTSFFQMFKGNPTLLLMTLSIFISAVGYFPVQSFMVKVIENIGYGNAELGWYWFCIAIFQMPTLWLSAVMLKKFKSRDLVLFSISYHLLQMIALLLCTTILPVYIVSAITGLNEGIYMFATLDFANRITKESEKTRAQSTVALGRTLGSIVGSTIAGALIDGGGVATMLIFGAVVCAIASVIMVFSARSYNKHFASA